MPLFPHQLKLGETYTPDAGVEQRTASAVAAIWALLEAPGLMLEHRRHLLGIAIWKYTEAPGVPPHPKYRLPFRTTGAMDVSSEAPVEHEHVWPRKWIIDRLLPAHERGWSRDELAAFMVEHGVACTVTKPEHLLLNACGDAEGWGRYAQAGVEVWDAAHRRPLVLPAVADTATEAERRGVLLSTRVAGALSEAVLNALAVHDSAVSPFLRTFLETAAGESVDLVPKYDAAGRPQTYIRIYDADLSEPTPIAVYVNYNGNLDFRLKPADVPDLLDLDGVRPWKGSYVRLRLDRSERLDTALQLLFETLWFIRES